MKRTILLALATSMAFFSAPVRAQGDGPTPAQAATSSEEDFTGGQLGAACAAPAGQDKNAQALAENTCTSYLRGLTQGLFLQSRIEDSGAAACMPKEGPIPVEDARSDVLDYLARNPAASDREAGVAAALAIVRAHSCGAD
jgi:Rap1a immunity proteins